jgi:hypothetical protein
VPLACRGRMGGEPNSIGGGLYDAMGGSVVAKTARLSLAVRQSQRNVERTLANVRQSLRKVPSIGQNACRRIDVHFVRGRVFIQT